MFSNQIELNFGPNFLFPLRQGLAMQDGHEFTYVAQSSLEHMVILLSAGCATTPNQISLFFSQSRYVHLYQEDQQTERLLIECLICQEILNLVMVTTHASKKELTL